jgi:hypothetical protein
LPGWQAFHEEYEDAGFSVVTVALDVEAAQAQTWIERAKPTHPSLIDSSHITDELFGFNNVPMAVWIDEEGMIVRPAESASIVASGSKNVELPDTVPQNIRDSVAEAAKIPDISEKYRVALVDWIENGAVSRYVMSPDQVVSASRPRDHDRSEAAANFELGHHLFSVAGREAAIPFWREAHRLDPENWTYKRQAWTLETTKPGEPSDMLQPPNATYEGSWLADVRASGGGENYLTIPDFSDAAP